MMVLKMIDVIFLILLVLPLGIAQPTYTNPNAGLPQCEAKIDHMQKTLDDVVEENNALIVEQKKIKSENQQKLDNLNTKLNIVKTKNEQLLAENKRQKSEIEEFKKNIPDTDPCGSSPCQNGGLCIVASEGYKCTCPPWKTGAICESAKSPSCQKVAECAAGVGIVLDLHEETPDTVLVSGNEGIARCSVNGGLNERVQQPEGTGEVFSTIVSDPGNMWTIARQSADLKWFVYRMNTTGLWGRVLEDEVNLPYKFEINNNRTIMILDRNEKSIKLVRRASQPSITATLNLALAATWELIVDFAVLPSGDVVASDYRNHCAHIVNPEGGLVATMGTCGSPGDGPGQLNNPYGVYVDRFSNILISDQNNYRISVFTSTGTYITTLCQGEVVRPDLVLVTSGGYLVMGNSQRGVKIFRYND